MAGITLTSKTINSTYDSLLKLTDNDGLTASFKKITDGLGNDSGISINNAGNVQISGTLNVSGTTTIGSVLRGNATLTIDPAAHGDNTGLVVIAGDLQVDGTTTTINSTTISLDDKNILLAADAANKAAANGAGITVETGTNDPVVTDATILYNGTNDTWDFNKVVTASSFTGDLTGNADTSTKWENTISLTLGDTAKNLDGSTDLTWTRAQLGITKANIDALNINADLLDGYGTLSSQNWFGGIPIVHTDGVMEIGKYIDFHDTDDTTDDHDYRLTSNNGSLSGSGDFSVGSNDITAATFIGDLTGNADTVDSKHATDFDLQYVTTNGATSDRTISFTKSSGTTYTPLTLALTTSGTSYVKQDFVTDTLAASTAYIIAYGSGNAQDGSLAIKNNSSHTTTNGTAGDIWFTTGASASDRMRIYGDSGDVRISNNLTVNGNAQVDDKITITGTTNNLVIDEEADGTWHLYDTFQSNGIKIYSTTGGMEFQYNGNTELTINGSGVVFNGTVDISNANLNIGAADIVFDTESANANRGLIWDTGGTYQSKLVSGGTNGGMVEIYTNMGGSITGSNDTFRVKEGSTADIALRVMANGDTETGFNFTSQGYVQAFGYLYTRDDLRVLNAAGNGWTTWATRSGGNYNLNVGSVTASSFSGNGSGITNVNADTLDGLNSTQFLRSDAADTMSGTLTITGSNGASRLRIEGTTPTMDFDDSDGDSFYIHVNSNNFYVLADRNGGGNYGDWETPHPLQLEADTNIGYLFGNRMLTTADEGSGNGIDADTVDGQHASAFASASHNHDDRYYTETESNNRYLIKPSIGTNIGETRFANTTYTDPNPGVARDAKFGDDGIAAAESYVSGISSAGGSFRAPIFYDSNNTGYYLDPSTTGRSINVNGYITAAIGNGAGFEIGAGGCHLTANVTGEAIFLGNSQIRFGPNNWNYNEWGGIKYTGGSSPILYIGGPASSVFTSNSSPPSTEINFSGTTFVSADSSFRAPVFYDSNDTNYYCNPNSTSNLSGLTVANQISGSINGASNAVAITGYGNGNFTFHQTSGSFNVFSGWHNYLISNHGNGSSYYNTIIAMPFWGSPRYSRLEGGTQRGPHEFWTSERTIDSSHDVYAPRYYDKNNTGYYVDPASTTNINALTATRIGVNPSGSSTSRYGISLYGGYSSGEPTYGLLFTGTALGTHGSVTGSWATYFTMNNDTSRGWIFRRAGSANCASISAGGTASFNGDVIAYYSDMRLKTKLGDIEDPIGKIQALNGFYYEPNEVAESYGYEKETRVGLSAQEVEAVLPEIVTDAPIGDGYKTVDYAKLVPVLVEAIKEQQKQIDELKSLINK